MTAYGFSDEVASDI